MGKNIVVLGAGGHARVVMEALSLAGEQIAGIIDADRQRVGESVCGVPILGTDRDIPRLFDPEEVLLANGLGAASSLSPRSGIYRIMKSAGFDFAQIRHPSAVLSPSATVGEGSQLLAGAVVGCGASVGQNVILNSSCSVDHDCRLGNHCHIAPSATLCGGVLLGEAVFVGAGATVIQGVSIGKGAIVGAGAVVVRNVRSGARVMGIPAREV